MAENQTRNTVQVKLHLLPADLAELDALAAELAEPGLPPNRSQTVRSLVRERMEARLPLPKPKRRKGRSR